MGKESKNKVEQRRIPFADLVFMEDNPRRISETDFEALVASIRKDPAFFDNRPCLVNHTDGKYLVYAGFQRAHAAHLRLDWQEIPCSVEADVPEATMRERAIRDNTHQGTWDSDVLSSWEFEVPELIEFGVPEFVFGEDAGEPEETDEAGDDAQPKTGKAWIPDCLFPSNNIYEVPTLDINAQAEIVSNPVIVWGIEKRTRRIDGGTVLFYVDDYRFEAIWDNPHQITDTGCAAMAEPNVSIYDTMPVSYALHLIYKKRWIARYLQALGVKTLVDLNVSVKFAEYNLLGVPEGWNAFATRGYLERTDYLLHEIEIAKKVSGKENPFMVVYGGGMKIREIVAKHNLIYIEQFRGFNNKDNG